MNFFAPFIFLFLLFGCAFAAEELPDTRSIGCGIEISADGTMIPLSKEKIEAAGKHAAKTEVPDDLRKKVLLRKISLKKLDAKIKAVADNHTTIPDEVRYLGGLTSIKYIAVVPEENDILLLGPAEGWRNDAAGNVVGLQSGKPVMMLEDFLSVFTVFCRSTNPQGGISCSIEPASESLGGIAKIQQQYPAINAKTAGAYAAELENAFGKMPITFTGIPPQSRYAKVLAAADLKMKRIALGLEPSAVRNVPSYVSLVSGSRPSVNPRFWLISEYRPVVRDSKKLTYQFGGLKVRAFAEADYFALRQNKKAANPDNAAAQWCKRFEENIEMLAKSQPVFGELINNMELTLAAAVIQHEKLLQKANCKLSILNDEAKLNLITYPQPKSAECRSIISKVGSSVIVACGGIEVNPFGLLQSGLPLNDKIDAERKELIQTNYKEDEWWSH